MAKCFATETAQDVALECDAHPRRLRLLAGVSVVERYYRDAPLLLIGEGSNEIQQLVIARRLLERYPA